ncbi:MAG: OmpH family outer membrane protein [Gemmatimonadales bacterium]
MRYRVSAVVVATALAMLGYKGISQPQGADTKLAYINSTQIIAQTPGAAEAQQTFDREMARWQTEMRALEDSLQQMISTYEQQQIMLSPEKKQERQQEILQKRLEYEQRANDLQEVAQRRQQELVQPIYDRITVALTQIRDEFEYTMIFDAAAGALIAADTTLDITDIVIERLKQTAQQTPGSMQD